MGSAPSQRPVAEVQRPGFVAIDLPHAALADEGGDVIVPETGAGAERHDGLGGTGQLYGNSPADCDERALRPRNTGGFKGSMQRDEMITSRRAHRTRLSPKHVDRRAGRGLETVEARRVSQ